MTRPNFIKVTLNDDELRQLNERRGRTPKATFLRKCALSEKKEIAKNDKKNVLIALARIGNNVNQIAKKVNIHFNDTQTVMANQSRTATAITQIGANISRIEQERLEQQQQQEYYSSPSPSM